MRITVWDLSRKGNHLSKVIRDRKIMTEFTRSICFTRIGKPVLMMDIKVSKGQIQKRTDTKINFPKKMAIIFLVSAC